MFGVTIDVAMSLLRQVLTIAGTALATKGLLAGDQVSAGVSAIVTIVSIAWSVTHHVLANDSAKPVDIAEHA